MDFASKDDDNVIFAPNYREINRLAPTNRQLIYPAELAPTQTYFGHYGFHDAPVLPHCRRRGQQPPIRVQEPGCGARVKGAKVQQAGCGARGKLYRCRKQCAVHAVRGSGAGWGLLHTEPEEGGIVSARKLQADAAINHRYRFRAHGEGCEGGEVAGLEEVELHLKV